MKDLLPQIIEWTKAQKPFAMARVIQTWGSSPRPIGSALLISADGDMVGSVSGGCVEGAVVREAKGIIAEHSARKLSYGVSDDEAWAVGLTCGGKIQVYLQAYPNEVTAVWEMFQWSLLHNKPFVLITSLSQNGNTLIDHEENVIGSVIEQEIILKAKDSFRRRSNEVVTIGESEYFIQVFPERRRLLAVGAAHITADLVHLASAYDFETIVIDPRSVFSDNTWFTTKPDKVYENYPSEVLVDIPLNQDTYAVILSHDPKIDDDALKILLRKPVAYIGALGSKKTHEKRVVRLKAAGFSDQEIGRIESPVGVDIHAQGAKEIALSIMGSLIRVKNDHIRSGAGDQTGIIHR